MAFSTIMQHNTDSVERRSLFRAISLLMLTASQVRPSISLEAAEEGPHIFGPRSGYSPQLGTLVSEMAWMREVVLMSVKGMTQDQLDFLLDNKANTIGALLFHLAATEKLYQLNTFDGIPPNKLEQEPAFKDWLIPMNLGDRARATIKGHNLDFYLNLLREGRERTLTEFHRRDDKWLMAVDKGWGWGPTNNLCKWFHVCEHESNHNGQIKLIKSRLPGAKPDSG
jgi:hypothetical protein